MPIQQGNYLDPAAIAQVKVGMTHSQVRYLLGTPMVPGGFDDARWDYDYYLNARHCRARRGHARSTFENNLVARVDSNVKQRARQPTAATSRRMPATPECLSCQPAAAAPASVPVAQPRRSRAPAARGRRSAAGTARCDRRRPGT